MKINGRDVWWKSEKENVAVTYSADDLGKKYVAYRRVRDDAGWALGWRYAAAFEFPGEAFDFLNKTPDVPAMVN